MADGSCDDTDSYIDEAYIDECLDASGIGVFHLVTIPACGLAAMSQSLQTNLLSFLQPCAGAAFHVPVASSAVLGMANFATSLQSGEMAKAAKRLDDRAVELGLDAADLEDG